MFIIIKIRMKEKEMYVFVFFFLVRDWRCVSLNGQLVCGMGYGMQFMFVNCVDFIIFVQGVFVLVGFYWLDYNLVYVIIYGGYIGLGMI